MAFTLVGSVTASPDACSVLLNFVWMETLSWEMAQIEVAAVAYTDTWLLSNMFVGILLNGHNCS